MILWCCVLGRWSDAMSLWEFVHKFQVEHLGCLDLARRIWRDFDKLRELTRGINSSSWNLGHLLKEALVNLRISLLSREYKSPPPASTRSRGEMQARYDRRSRWCRRWSMDSDEQTNGINFIPFVCPSTLLHDGSGCRWCRRWSMDSDGQTNGINFIPFVCPSIATGSGG